MSFKKKIKPLHKDSRGKIVKLAEGDFASALLITSKKGSVRANHYHKKDSHWCYMISGSMRYWYKDLSKKNNRRRSLIIRAGDSVYTPPMLAHAMEFLEASQFLALTAKKRDRTKYENDTVRMKLLKTDETK